MGCRSIAGPQANPICDDFNKSVDVFKKRKNTLEDTDSPELIQQGDSESSAVRKQNGG
jgi:hypothetical protein